MKKTKLKLRLNIGSVDRDRLGLTETEHGKVVEVDEKTAAVLARRGWAEPVADEKPAANRPPAPAGKGDAPAKGEPPAKGGAA